MFISTINPSQREAPPSRNINYHHSTDSILRRFRKTSSGFESPVKPSFNQPTFNHFQDLTVREVAGIKEPSPFGFEPFVIPKIPLEPRLKGFAPGTSKNISFIDIQQKAEGWKPGPIYVPHSDWTVGTVPQKHKFGKYKKLNFLDHIEKREKKLPAPTSYEVFHYKKQRPPGAFKL